MSNFPKRRYRSLLLLGVVVVGTLVLLRTPRPEAGREPASARSSGQPNAVGSSSAEPAGPETAGKTATPTSPAVATHVLFAYAQPANAAALIAALPAPAREVHYVRANAALAEGKASPFWQAPGKGRVVLPLPDGSQLNVVIDESEMLGAERFTSVGRIEGRPGSRAVFAYFRWLPWLDPQASWQKQLEHAADLQGRFAADEKAIKPETLAARAVPGWVRDEMELTPEYLRQLQREPALWLRARPGTAEKLARELGDCMPSDRAPDALRYNGAQDLFLTPAFHRGAFEIQDLASQIVGHACAAAPGETVRRDRLVAGDGPAGERTVDVQINRLRRKIEADPANPLYLQTVRGIGYRLAITA